MNYGDGSTERGKINPVYFIIGIVILAMFLLSDGSFSLKSSSLSSQSIVSEDGGETFSRGTDTNDTTPDINNQITDSSLISEPNSCGSMTYGYPDYIGTEKEGFGCADTIVPERDLECLSNPPLNYDGIIDLGSPLQLSDPEITCCDSDGTCMW